MADPARPERAAYESLTKVFNQLVAIGGAQNRLYRDMQAVMAKGSAKDHDQVAVALTEIAHEKMTDPRMKVWLDEAESNTAQLTPDEQANLKAMRRQHTREAALPADLAAALKLAEYEGERLHTETLEKGGSWNEILPFFRHQMELQKQAAAIWQKQTGAASAYDALLESYSPGWTSADYDKLFDKLEPFLKKLLPDVMDKQAKEVPALPITGPFSAEGEEKLCRELADHMGFDRNRGVLYFIPDHPSAGGTRNDVRVTGRPDADSFLRPLYDLMHELGHGLYDQNVPDKMYFQPAGQALGMDIHESQSLVWEFVVGKSPEFAQWLSSRAQEIFGRPGDAALSAENIEKDNQRVTPNLVRISMETSEVSYLLHIIMRYRLEKQMIEGKLDPADLPEAWGKMSDDMFGRRPKDNAEGCLQDVHWFCGLWGYFPSYAVGYMNAVQLFDAAVKAHPDIPAEISKGNFAPLKEWLTENVHEKGSLVTAKDIIRDATGEDLSADHLMNHLNRRYLDLPATGPAPLPKRTPPGVSP
jgi:carboxypeptidase Taq